MQHQLVCAETAGWLQFVLSSNILVTQEEPVAFAYESDPYMGLSDGFPLPPHDWSSPAGLGTRAMAKRPCLAFKRNLYPVPLPRHSSFFKIGQPIRGYCSM